MLPSRWGWGSYDPLASWFSSLRQQKPEVLFFFFFWVAWVSWISSQRNQMSANVSDGGVQICPCHCWGGGNNPFPFSRSRRRDRPSSLIWLHLSLESCGEGKGYLKIVVRHLCSQECLRHSHTPACFTEWHWFLKRKKTHDYLVIFMDHAHSPFLTCTYLISLHGHKWWQKMRFKVLLSNSHAASACSTQKVPCDLPADSCLFQQVETTSVWSTDRKQWLHILFYNFVQWVNSRKTLYAQEHSVTEKENSVINY